MDLNCTLNQKLRKKIIDIIDACICVALLQLLMIGHQSNEGNIY
uniref:Uncharacterized protein n=1 Tax=Vitis vinifera TaxID=29760 RepID=F6HJ13_VITVI